MKNENVQQKKKENAKLGVCSLHFDAKTEVYFVDEYFLFVSQFAYGS